MTPSHSLWLPLRPPWEPHFTEMGIPETWGFTTRGRVGLTSVYEETALGLWDTGWVEPEDSRTPTPWGGVSGSSPCVPHRRCSGPWDLGAPALGVLPSLPGPPHTAAA